MINVQFGILLMSFIVFCLFGILWTYKRGLINWCVLIIILIGFSSRLYLSLDQKIHGWDERYHALVAKNMIDNPLKPTLYKTPLLPYDYKSWTSNHIWLHKQPFPLWCIGLSIAVLGSTELAVRLPSILLSSLVIFVTFLIGKRLFNHKIGLIAAFLFAIHGLSIELVSGRTATDHIDVFFQSLIVISLYFAVRHSRSSSFWHLILMALFCGLAILTKWLPALIVLVLWFILSVHLKNRQYSIFLRQLFLTIIIILMVVLPWQIWIFTQFPDEALWEYQYNTRHIFESLGGHGKPWYYFIHKISVNYGILIYLPILWACKKMILSSSRELWFVNLWWAIPLIFFSFASTKMQGYIVFSAPAFFLITALIVDNLYAKLPLMSTVKKAVFYCIILILFLSPVLYFFERVKPFDVRSRTENWVVELKELNVLLNDDKKYLVFNEPHYIEAMFYCRNVTAYPISYHEAKKLNHNITGYTIIERKLLNDTVSYDFF